MRVQARVGAFGTSGAAKAGRRPCIRRARLILALLLPATGAWAQFSRLADEIEVKRLDVHPRPSVRNEIGTRFYGVVDLGVASGRDVESLIHGRVAPNPDHRLGGIGPSFIGIRSDETLDRGWYAHVQLEHGFDADTGRQRRPCRALWDPAAEQATLAAPPRRPKDCSAFWDRRASMGLSNRDLGRLDIGLLEQPARQIAFMASPWGPDSVASPGEAWLYLPPDPARETLPGRSPQAVTWQSPYSVNYQLQLHAALRRSSDGGTAGAGRTTEQHGASFEAKLGAWQAGIGYQRWDDGSRTMPLAVVYMLGPARLSGGLTTGERLGVDFRHLFVGGAWRERSGPRPGEWKLGLGIFELDGRSRQWKLGAGYERPFSRRTSWQANVSVRSPDPVASRIRFDLGLRHAFAP